MKLARVVSGAKVHLLFDDVKRTHCGLFERWFKPLNLAEAKAAWGGDFCEVCFPFGRPRPEELQRYDFTERFAAAPSAAPSNETVRETWARLRETAAGKSPLPEPGGIADRALRAAVAPRLARLEACEVVTVEPAALARSRRKSR